jgi:hypothetical protein
MDSRPTRSMKAMSRMGTMMMLMGLCIEFLGVARLRGIKGERMPLFGVLSLEWCLGIYPGAKALFLSFFFLFFLTHV